MTTTNLEDRSKKIFWIPMLYNFTIRLKNNPSKITSWIFINLFPTIYYSLITQENINIKQIITLIIFIIGTYYQYEWGYIYNDTKSIKKEENPSKRLTAQQSTYAENHFTTITILRITIFIISLITIYTIEPNTLPAIATSILCPLLFYIYNNWRNNRNVWLYFWLVTSRFLPFALLFNQTQITPIILIILIYPLEIGIERFSMPNYRYKFISKIIPSEKSKSKFRAGYYLTISIILTIIYLSEKISIIEIIPFYVFSLYRCLLMQKNKA